jgi:hypothetical protein
MGRPISWFWSVIGWCGATAVFAGLTAILGGPTSADSAVSTYSTWAIAHARWTCLYPPLSYRNLPPLARPFTHATPLYPLLSGVIAALFRIGHAVAFPAQAQLGPNCSAAIMEMYRWSVRSGAVQPTLRIGYLSWFALLFGTVSLLMATGRGRTRWEPTVLILIAVASPAEMALVDYFHPQDIVAMGLILGAVACVVRNRWAWAGVLIGFAVVTQQFALLVAAPLLVVAPAPRRLAYLAGGVGAAAVIDVPVIIANSGRAVRAVVIGTGYSPSYGGTILWEAYHRGPLFFVTTRFLPIAAAIVVAWWAHERLGTTVLAPVPLLSLIATSLSFRLLFEENLWGYYFTAVAVMLIVLDAVRGQIRGTTLAWLGLVTLAFNRVPSPYDSNYQSWDLTVQHALPAVLASVAALVIIVDASRRRVRPYLVTWLVLVTVAFVKLPGLEALSQHTWPVWLWQLILVSTAIVLAAGPLVSSSRAALADNAGSGASTRLV